MKYVLLIIALALLAYLCYAPLPTLYCKRLRRNALPGRDHRLLLTFDDGPDRQYTPQLLRVLADSGVQAVFFVVEQHADACPDVVEQMMANGHVLGYHGKNHRSMWRMSPMRTKQVMREADAFLRAHGDSRLYRPPFGHLNLCTLYYARRYKLNLLLWTVMAQDWRLTPPSVLVSRLQMRSGAGSIICLHDSGADSGGEPGAPAQTIAALQLFIPKIKQQGYCFTCPSEKELTHA